MNETILSKESIIDIIEHVINNSISFSLYNILQKDSLDKIHGLVYVMDIIHKDTSNGLRKLIATKVNINSVETSEDKRLYTLHGEKLRREIRNHLWGDDIECMINT